jgi:hypothetical protein
VRSPGASIFECRHIFLESQSLSAHGCSEDQAAAQTIAQAGLHDALRGGSLFVEGAVYASSGEVFPDWLVHGLPPKRDNGPEMVDGES